MSDLELIEKLESGASAFIKGIKNFEAMEKSLRLIVQNLEQRKISMTKEIESLQSQWNGLNDKIRTETKDQHDLIENKTKELEKKDSELQRQIGISISKQNELDDKKREMESSKNYYDARAKEYDSMLSEIKEKKARLQAALSA